MFRSRPDYRKIDPGYGANRKNRTPSKLRQQKVQLLDGEEFRHTNQPVLLNARKKYGAESGVADDMVCSRIVRKNRRASEGRTSESCFKTDRGRNSDPGAGIRTGAKPDNDFIRRTGLK